MYYWCDKILYTNTLQNLFLICFLFFFFIFGFWAKSDELMKVIRITNIGFIILCLVFFKRLCLDTCILKTPRYLYQWRIYDFLLLMTEKKPLRVVRFHLCEVEVHYMAVFLLIKHIHQTYCLAWTFNTRFFVRFSNYNNTKNSSVI